MSPTPAIVAVALWTAANAFVLTWLSVSIGKLRGELKVSIGDGGEPRLVRAMRGQANFTENVPLALLLLLMMALIGTPAWIVHIFGLVLTVSRVLHGMHFLTADAPGWQRTAGAGLTILVQLFAALGLLAHGLYRMVAG